MQLGQIKEQITQYLIEDGFDRKAHYWQSLPSHPVNCQLKFKSDCILAGSAVFIEVFNSLASGLHFSCPSLLEREATSIKNGTVIPMTLPFNVALSGERVALNLLQHACAIATQTHRFVAKAKAKNIAILDTRKTTPGLRWLEKYAVICGGGQNHRWCQTDMWMIKDNHKAVFGGVGAAAQFFKQLGSFYNPVLLEVHSLPELQEGLELGLRHFMLDNFGPQDIAHAVAMKRPGVTFEISGGVTLENIDLYLQSGIDAISLGSLTQGVPRVDISFKLENAK